MKNTSGTLLQRLLPSPVRRRIYRFTRWPLVGFVRFGNMRRLTPICRDWGFSRGMPIDRYYIDQFLSANLSAIHGHVLEIGNDMYTIQFGGKHVTQSDVLHVTGDHPKATMIGDLTRAEHIPPDTFDCIISTQTLQFIYDVKAAIFTLHRILKPGSALLVTVPSITSISRYDMNHWGDYWRFTSLSARLLFEEVFPVSNITIQAYGNVLTAVAFLHGVTSEELNQKELNYVDEDYEVLITIKAVKPEIEI